MARRATAIAQLKGENENVLLLDSGETLFRGGDSVESQNPEQGALIVAAMNAMEYDALALGGRDLEAPLSTVQARLQEADFDILSANIQQGVAEGEGPLPGVQPYLLRQFGGHTVAIVGATSAMAGRHLERLGLEGPQDILEAVGEAVKTAQKRADVIIVLSNLDSSEVESLAQTVPGIDVIIGVYRGQRLSPVSLPGLDGEVIFQASGTRGEYLGVLNLQLDEQGRVTGYEGRPVTLTDDYADDPEMLELFHDYATEP